MRLRRISDPQVSPDGRYVAFSVSEGDLEVNGIRRRLWLIDLTTKEGKPQPRSVAGVDDWNGRWACDSRGLYFLSSRSGSAQVWYLSLATGAATQVTHLPIDVETFKVSPVGDRLLLSLEVFPDCPDLECTAARLEAAARSGPQGQLHDRLFIRHWDRWSDGRQSHLFSVALADSTQLAGAPIDLSGRLDADVPSKPRGGSEEFNFSPDGTRVVFAARIKGKDEAWSTNFDVFEASAGGRDEPRNLTADNPAWDAEPTYSPDGRWLAWKAMDRPQNEADRFHLMIKDLRSGVVKPLAGDWDRSVSRFAFSADSRRILATADHLGQTALWSIELSTAEPILMQSQGQVTEFSVGPELVVFGLGALDTPVDLYRLDTDSTAAQRLTRLNDDLLAARSLAAFEQFSFRGWRGERVYGYVMHPYGFDPARKYPLALLVHGGPQMSFANGWSYRWNPQVYAGWGYAVVFIDFHGSTGYGQGFTDSITGDWSGKPLEDLCLGLAAACERYTWIDDRRACAIGASYGGYLINWIEGHWRDGFRCLVNYAGVFDTRGLYYQTDEMWLDEYEFGGPEFQVPRRYEEHNPMLHVARWQTPMLVGHGLLDCNVPSSQGVSTFTALQRRGIESRLLIFPNEGHFILRPRNSLQWHEAVRGWLDRWT
jgi:dipeptidyl aminopeptidase/acylaminoacyl peptidase